MSRSDVRIRRLGLTDRALLIRYLERDRAHNLFHLANMEQLGMEHPDLRYYGAFAGDELVGELMLLRANAGVVWDEPAALPHFAQILLRERAAGLSGRRERVEPLLAQLPDSVVDRVLPAKFAAITAETLRPWAGCGERLATLSDVPAVTELYDQNLLLRTAAHAENLLRLERTLTTGGLIALVERDGRVVSSARTSGIGHGMAMIGGVVTLPAYRRQGFARACTGLLSRLLLDRRIEPYLTYDPADPAASGAYHSLGFTDIGAWLLAFLKPAV
jgi:predicted GNAT family acetyltransferase